MFIHFYTKHTKKYLKENHCSCVGFFVVLRFFFFLLSLDHNNFFTFKTHKNKTTHERY